ncbi:MAG: hypothetical protein QXT77_05335 [Candidatus Methanomethylicaceae archaeon]
MTIEDIMQSAGVSDIVAQTMIVEMCERGIVEHKGHGKYGVITHKERDLKSLLDFVKDDALAATYQSLGQYRNELIKMIASILESENHG